jgi:hypothetical protein
MPKTIANATVDRLMHHAHVVITTATRFASPKPHEARGGEATHEVTGQFY